MAARPVLAAAVLATALLASGLAPVPALADPAPEELAASLVGRWAAPRNWPLEAIHAALLPTGQVLVWQGQNNVRLWDPASGALAGANLGGDKTIFCSGHTLLPDGRLLVVGGLGGAGGSNQGHARTHLFDPWTRAWQRGPDMAAGRWYPSALTLPDGRALALSGLDEAADNNRRVEALAPGQGWDLLEGAERQLGVYPRLHVLPSGEVVRTGPEAQALFLDPVAARWRTGPANPGGARGGGGSVLLPGLEQVLVFGGQFQGSVRATADVLDLRGGEPAWRATGAMAVPRLNLNPVLLADGSVLAVGGGPQPAKSPAALAPERYDPATGQWQLLAPAQRGRTYHSTALLLPDARVLVAGSDVEVLEGVPPATFGRTAEVFSPPYLFRGARPTIAAAPGAVGYGQDFAVATPDAADVGRVALVRPGTTTHSVNFDQRYVDLSFEAAGDALAVRGPPGPNHAPPGHYMLFLVSDEGVPSVAAMVRVG